MVLQVVVTLGLLDQCEVLGGPAHPLAVRVELVAVLVLADLAELAHHAVGLAHLDRHDATFRSNTKSSTSPARE